MRFAPVYINSRFSDPEGAGLLEFTQHAFSFVAPELITKRSTARYAVSLQFALVHASEPMLAVLGLAASCTGKSHRLLYTCIDTLLQVPQGSFMRAVFVNEHNKQGPGNHVLGLRYKGQEILVVRMREGSTCCSRCRLEIVGFVTREVIRDAFR